MKAVLLSFLVISLMACSDQSKVAQPTDGSSVVATVAGEVITENELNNQIKKLTGLESLTSDQALIRKNVIDSMVLAKLMAKKQKTLMSQDDLIQLELDVKAYREERLAQMFMSENVQTLPPSADQVKAYYDANLHRFGGGTFADITRYVLADGCMLPQSEGESIKVLEEKILEISCEKTSQNQTLLLSKLSSETGRTSEKLTTEKPLWMTNNSGQTIIFIRKIEQRKAAPLSDVAADIRKMMAPMQFKSAIASVKAQLLNETEVEILDN